MLALFPFSTQIALANGIAVTGDTVTISASVGGFSQAKSLLATPGTIPNTDNIPTASITSDLTFTFNVAAATGSTIAAGTYTFQGGMFIDQDGSSRRLEISVSGISLTFDAMGNITSGSIPAGTNAIVSGRGADGSTTAVITLTNSLLHVTDSTFFITAGAQIAEIETSASIILQDLTSTFTAAASYDYGIFLKQTGGVAGLTFGLTDGTTFFGCAAGNPMVLAGQSSFAGASALAGRMGVGQAAGGSATAYAGSCVTVPAIGGGGGGGSPPDEVEENEETTAEVAGLDTATTDLTNNIAAEGFSDAVATELDALISDSVSAATSVATGLKDGSVSVETGVSLFGSLGTQLSTLSDLFQAIDDDDPNKAEKQQQLSNSGQPLMAALKSLTQGFVASGLTEAEGTQVKMVLSTFTSRVRSWLTRIYESALIANGTPISEGSFVADTSEFLNDFETSISNLISIPGFTIDNSLLVEIQLVSETAAEGVLNELGTELGLSIIYESDVATQALLSNNATLLDRLLDVVGINLGAATSISKSATALSFQAGGLSSSDANALAGNLAAFIQTDNLSVGSSTVSELLTAALTGVTSLEINSVTGVVSYTTVDGDFSVLVQEVQPGLRILPTGTFTAANGSSIIVNSDVVIRLAPAPDDLLGFASAIEVVGEGDFTISIGDDGVVSLTDVNSPAVFKGLFSSDALANGTPTGETVFEGPVGDPSQASYFYVVQYAAGTRQIILPAIADELFFQSVASYGFQISTDRSTGIIDIDGMKFRPDYFQTPSTSSDSVYRISNADSSGVAYRAVDANNDGITDYQVFTNSGVQTVYGLP
ncbi:MAG: hypothetical protein COA96_08125 [SAR86 cluster bacterium]|uniref:Uncharacterized protein n=1 Tax=SAR86 cluster bacterium TaxID=2030880 RepID=A0A2A5B161_9GAMM|nr:MAG: hypothetical protein COA96_08125 [SAR86 cluster bacterium]